MLRQLQAMLQICLTASSVRQPHIKWEEVIIKHIVLPLVKKKKAVFF